MLLQLLDSDRRVIEALADAVRDGKITDPQHIRFLALRVTEKALNQRALSVLYKLRRRYALQLPADLAEHAKQPGIRRSIVVQRKA